MKMRSILFGLGLLCCIACDKEEQILKDEDVLEEWYDEDNFPYFKTYGIDTTKFRIIDNGFSYPDRPIQKENKKMHYLTRNENDKLTLFIGDTTKLLFTFELDIKAPEYETVLVPYEGEKMIPIGYDISYVLSNTNELSAIIRKRNSINGNYYYPTDILVTFLHRGNNVIKELDKDYYYKDIFLWNTNSYCLEQNILTIYTYQYYIYDNDNVLKMKILSRYNPIYFFNDFDFVGLSGSDIKRNQLYYINESEKIVDAKNIFSTSLINDKERFKSSKYLGIDGDYLKFLVDYNTLNGENKTRTVKVHIETGEKIAI